MTAPVAQAEQEDELLHKPLAEDLTNERNFRSGLDVCLRVPTCQGETRSEAY